MKIRLLLILLFFALALLALAVLETSRITNLREYPGQLARPKASQLQATDPDRVNDKAADEREAQLEYTPNIVREWQHRHLDEISPSDFSQSKDIRQAVELAFLHSPSEAVKLVAGLPGEGVFVTAHQRLSELLAVEVDSGDPDGVLSLFKSEKARWAFVSGWSITKARTDTPSALGLASRAGVIQANMAIIFGYAILYGNGVDTIHFLEGHFSGSEKEELLLGAFGQWGGRDPKAALSALDSFESTVAKPELAKALFEGWATENSAAVERWALSNAKHPFSFTARSVAGNVERPRDRGDIEIPILTK